MEQLWYPSTWGYNSQELMEPGLNLSNQVSAIGLPHWFINGYPNNRNFDKQEDQHW
jgi:hypothetical protein